MIEKFCEAKERVMSCKVDYLAIVVPPTVQTVLMIRNIQFLAEVLITFEVQRQDD